MISKGFNTISAIAKGFEARKRGQSSSPPRVEKSGLSHFEIQEYLGRSFILLTLKVLTASWFEKAALEDPSTFATCRSK